MILPGGGWGMMQSMHGISQDKNLVKVTSLESGDISNWMLRLPLLKQIALLSTARHYTKAARMSLKVVPIVLHAWVDTNPSNKNPGNFSPECRIPR